MASQMKITILGSGTCVPRLDRYPCAVLIRTDTATVLLDAGPGIIGQILKTGISLDDIDAILLSHLHPDHCADIVPFLFATRYPRMMRNTPLLLAGGTGLRRWFDRVNLAYGDALMLPDGLLDIRELPEAGGPESFVGGLSLAWGPVRHKPESRAFRITDNTGCAAVYSGDTEPCDALVDLARNADLLICESALPDEFRVPNHLTPSLAGDIAARACVGQLVLTHLYPECDGRDLTAQCRKTFSGRVTVAEDLMVLSPGTDGSRHTPRA